MVMSFKYQVFLCPWPRDLLLVSYNHIDSIRDLVRDTPVVVNQVDEAHRRIIEVFLDNCYGIVSVVSLFFWLSPSPWCRYTPRYPKASSSFSDKRCSYFFRTCTSVWVLCYQIITETEIKPYESFLYTPAFYFLFSGVTFPQERNPESQRTVCPVDIRPTASWDRCPRANQVGCILHVWYEVRYNWLTGWHWGDIYC